MIRRIARRGLPSAARFATFPAMKPTPAILTTLLTLPLLVACESPRYALQDGAGGPHSSGPYAPSALPQAHGAASSLVVHVALVVPVPLLVVHVLLLVVLVQLLVPLVVVLVLLVVAHVQLVVHLHKTA